MAEHLQLTLIWKHEALFVLTVEFEKQRGLLHQAHWLQFSPPRLKGDTESCQSCAEGRGWPWCLQPFASPAERVTASGWIWPSMLLLLNLLACMVLDFRNVVGVSWGCLLDPKEEVNPCCKCGFSSLLSYFFLLAPLPSIFKQLRAFGVFKTVCNMGAYFPVTCPSQSVWAIWEARRAQISIES